jgi:diguanylate cyclase (GGDEF)-like protein
MNTGSWPITAFDLEEDDDRLREKFSPEAMTVDLVSAFAGDRPMTGPEGVRLHDLEQRRGKVFYADLIYAVSHHRFAPELAEEIWNHVLGHKVVMSTALGRNVRIVVAMLDYLSNITGDLASSTLMAEAHVAEIVDLSLRDGMTGLFNHSAFYELLDLELRNHRRYGSGTILILLDIDDFKRVNDQHGHQEGDRVLVELARAIETETRDSDICCRFGGEEFAVILPFTSDPREAFGIAERIRAGAQRIVSHGQAVTISAGVALCDETGQTAHALVERADRALYTAKRNGKNMVVLSRSSRRQGTGEQVRPGAG